MDVKIFIDNIDNIEKKALYQLCELATLDAFKDCKIRIMPDVHAGSGCVIGFTADLGDKVIPNIVGVDIGCGMLTAKLKTKDLDLKKVDEAIRKVVPSGRNVQEEEQDFDLTDLLCYSQLKDLDWLRKSLGSLGASNHFIEVDVDLEGNFYLVIHTGSRNLGKQVADIYQKQAIKHIYNLKEDIKKLVEGYKSAGREREIEQAIKDFKKVYKKDIPKELCYLEGEDRENYLHDMKICQEFATANRNKILDSICEELGIEYEEKFETVHNYISFEDNIVRKGAISAKKGEKVLIPMNMRDGCILAVGKGNDDWNNSAPHGAGRIMSRDQARQEIKLEDYKETMKNIYTTSVNVFTIDEAPFAYKPAQEIIDNIQDTVDIIEVLKPIYNFKASEEQKY